MENTALRRVCVGAADATRLRQMVEAMVCCQALTELPFEDVAFTLNRRAAGHAVRRCVTVANGNALIQALCREQGDDLLPVTDDDASGRIVEIPCFGLDRDCQVGLPEPDRPPPVPKNDPASRLTTIWCRNLGLTSISPQTSFRAEGGHSMMALTMLEEINAAFVRQFDLDWIDRHDLFQQQLEGILSVNGGVARQGIKLLRPATGLTGRRLVLVHASLSGYEVYKPLAQHIAADTGVLGIDSHNLYADVSSVETDADALVQRYLTELLPQLGQMDDVPLFLGGWSLGGLLAFSLARQLCGASCPVHGVVLLDSVRYHDRYAALFADDAEDYFVDVRHLLGQHVPAAHGQSSRLDQVWQAERDMARHYRAGPPVCPVLNLIATVPRKPLPAGAMQQAFAMAKRDNGWSGVSQTDSIAANHMQMIDDQYARQIADRINFFMASQCSTI